MAYVDYSYYSGFSKGNAVPEETFNNLIDSVTDFIDYITFNRVKDLAEIPEEVKKASCAVLNMQNKIEADGGLKASESNGRYSVTYAGIDSNTTEFKILYEVAKRYLAYTGLLYRGH